MKQKLTTLLLLMAALTMSAQTFHYDAEGLQPMTTCVEIENTSQGRISEGIISWIDASFSDEKNIVKSYRKLPDREEFLLSWSTGVKYLELGMFEMYGNVDVAVVLTSFPDSYRIEIKRVIFEKGDKKFNALQKNSKFFTSNAKVRYDTMQGQGKGREVHLSKYFDLLIGAVTEHINRENYKDR